MKRNIVLSLEVICTSLALAFELSLNQAKKTWVEEGCVGNAPDDWGKLLRLS